MPSTSEVNPIRDGKDNFKAITLRSRKTIEKPIQNNVENDEDGVKSEENNVGNSEIVLKLLKRVLELQEKQRSY